MRREQLAALSWGVGLVFAAIGAVILGLASVGAVGYCVGAWCM